MSATALSLLPTNSQFGFGAVDIVVNMYTPEIIAEGRAPTDENFRDKVRVEQGYRRGLTLEQYIEKMDRAGIERSLLVAVRSGDLRFRGSIEIPYEKVTCCRTAISAPVFRPRRRRSNPRHAGLRDLDRAVKEYGFVGAHLYPHWFGLAPDAANYYPYYARCAELGIPIMMQVGQNLIYQRDRRLPSVGGRYARPGGDRLSRIEADRHPYRHPWTEEMIASAEASERLHGGDAYAPKHWGASAVHYANTYGQDKLMFGTDWPVIDPERAVERDR